MKARIRFLLYYFFFWLLYFVLFRGLFLWYHQEETSKLSWDLITGTFFHGIWMDISFTSYLCLLVFLLVAISVFLPGRILTNIVKWYTLIVLAFISFLSVADLELFTEWGFRLDATPLAYVNTPMEMAASTASSPYIMLIGSIVLITISSFLLYRKFIHAQLKDLTRIPAIWGIIFLLLTGSLIIPIRGGFQLAPLNQSVAFFSKNDFANQAALNVPWNVFRSLTQEVYSNTNPYRSYPDSSARKLVEHFYYNAGTTSDSLIRTTEPNVIVVLWESLSAAATPALGGRYPHVLPQFESLIEEGILFENFYANGDRSDKGIVSILSGYPPQPKRSIVKIPNKTAKLPMITQYFKRAGYQTSFFHGGELEFANIKTFLQRGDFDQIVGKESFNSEDMNSKWGAHDHVVFDKAFDELKKHREPFFSMIFTLSSHEPFEIPMENKFPGEELEQLYLSSLHYTDRSLGTFVQKIKNQPWYENTLVIVLADHGHRLLNDSGRYLKEKYHVPMLWFGGALNVKDTVVSRYCSQTDLASTLLGLTDMENHAFNWSRDIFNAQNQEGAFYVYNDGISFVDTDGVTIYDHQSGDLLEASTDSSREKIKLCKAHLQYAYQDYLNK